MTELQIWGIVRDAGTVGVLFLAVWAFTTGKIVPRWMFDAQVKQTEKADAEAELWKRLHYDRALPLAARAVDELTERRG